MSEKILTNLGATKIAERTLSLLLDSLSVSEGRVWLVSPWLSDVEFSVSSAGHFSSQLGGKGDTLTLTELLIRLNQKHDVHVVIRPPHQHVSVAVIRKLRQQCSTYLKAEEDEELQQSLRFEDVMESLTDEIGHLVKEVTQHLETLRCARDLIEQGVRLSYVESLHAKVLWTPIGAILGSANATRSGLFNNPELSLETSYADQLDGLEEALTQIQNVSVPRQEYVFSGVNYLEDEENIFGVLSPSDRRRLETMRTVLKRLNG